MQLEVLDADTRHASTCTSAWPASRTTLGQHAWEQHRVNKGIQNMHIQQSRKIFARRNSAVQDLPNYYTHYYTSELNSTVGIDSIAPIIATCPT